MKKFDIVIIGAGPAGYVAAISAARNNQKVLLIEAKEVGGTCLNQGCIPTKTLLHASSGVSQKAHFETMGIEYAISKIDYLKLDEYKNKVIEKLQHGIEGLIKANKIEYIQGVAQIEDEHSVVVNDEVFETKTILIASGSKISPNKIVGSEYALSSNEVLKFEQSGWKKAIIIGAGVIGIEFATLLNNLGTQVTLLEYADRPLMMCDREISQNLMMIMKKRNIQCICKAKVQEISKNQGIKVSYFMDEEIHSVHADAVIIATGRIANLVESKLDLRINQGRYQVNEHFQTNYENIYAVGDCSSEIQLAHLASAQALNAVSHSLNKFENIDIHTVPSCVYTNPEIAWVGLSEAEAIEKGRKIKIGKYSMLGNGKSILEQQDRGFVKIICDDQSEEVLGACLMCAHATELISCFSMVISNHLTLNQCLAVIFPHPTFSEGIHEALEDVNKNSIHTIYRVSNVS